MFSTVFKLSFITLALALHVQGHAMPSPALGVQGAPKRSDVQRPSTAKPCGNVNIAATLDTSTAIPAAADGTVLMNMTNFNAGTDGARFVASLGVDPTGLGKNFTAVNVTVNGDKNPTGTGTQQLQFSLPSGTACTGGKTGDLCLLTVKTSSGFGGCVVVSQALTAGSATPAAGDSTIGSTTNTTTTTASAPQSSKACKAKAAKRRALGTRAPRALRRSLHANPVFGDMI
ncbi:unnamed protein product [Mycena citricolor]|uniref:Uncharacterized protein n=1 Tax=Mycena citricolor TaxID=2018698 RepID=A0AAD2HEQ8_9AGAR|nr:unnamed protein product [Mycena citricolor]CAK5283659.1 unnamed protein product [Mycena citricolor]